jgi:hypothetical protein
VGAESDILVADLDPCRRERSPVSVEAISTRGEPEWIIEGIADVPDPPMAKVEQMLGCEFAASHVVAEDPWEVRCVLERVDEDDRHIGSLKPREVVLGWRQRHDEKAVGALAERERPEIQVALLDGLDVVDVEVELAISQCRIDATKPFGGLGPGQEGNDDRNGLGLTKAESPGRQARRKCEFVGDGDDPSLRVVIDERAVVQGTRGGRGSPRRAERHRGSSPASSWSLHCHWNRFHVTASRSIPKVSSWSATMVLFLDEPTAGLGLALGLGVLLLVLDGLGWRVVAAVLNRERLITGSR